MVERSTISRNQIVQQILRISHKNLDDYLNLGIKAVHEEPELFGHLIAWNFIKGEIRDSKVALPVIALRGPADLELLENAVAHLVSLDPRNLVRAIQFNRTIRKNVPATPGAGNLLEKAVTQYLRVRESNWGWWTRAAVQHRDSMKALYALYHIKPTQAAQAILFKKERPKGSVFQAIHDLRTMQPKEAAGTILHFKIPFLIAIRAVGGIKDKPDLLLALIEASSGAELITNAKMFQKFGVFDRPELKAAFDNAVNRAKSDKRVSSLKAGKAAEVLEQAGVKRVAQKMKVIHEEKLEQIGGIEGDWLILADRSGSMHQAIVIGRKVAALISQQVKGNVYLVFFNTDPTKYDVTGKTPEEIEVMTRNVRASGGTSVGCGLDMLRVSGIVVNGIVIVSDGGDNTRPFFHDAYKKYVDQVGMEPTVYHLWLPGDRNDLGSFCERSGVQLQYFDISHMDYYALPNLIKTLRASKYMLVDEILNTPLLTLAQVFSRKEAV